MCGCRQSGLVHPEAEKVSVQPLTRARLQLTDGGSFSHVAQARIQWLEGIIRDRLPDVNLADGPQVELQLNEQNADGPDSQSTPKPSLKRRSESGSPGGHQEAFAGRAHSVAVNLGMLSLNSDSSQKHYLGSSSGLLFTQLIGASPSVESSITGTETPGDTLHQEESVPSHLTPTREASRRQQRLLMLQKLRQVREAFPPRKPAGCPSRPD